MKKFITLLVAILLCTAFLTACKQSDVAQNPSLSELRSDIFVANSGELKVIAVSGIRENDFAIDGISQPEKTEFTIITLTSDTTTLVGEYNFSAQIGGVVHEGKMVRHPFNQSYSAEIKMQNKQSSLKVIITSGTQELVFEANSVRNQSFIDGSKAFDIANSKLKKSVESKKNVGYEIFIRLIENPINSSGGYYWYVAFIFTDKTTLAVLIDPVTTEIAAIKN